MNDGRVSYLWLIPIVLIFPLMEILIYYFRFGNLEGDMVMNSVVFVPMGLISGLFLIAIINRENGYAMRGSLITAYIIGSLIALPLVLAAGLLVPIIIAVALIGILPQILAVYAVYKISDRKRRS